MAENAFAAAESTPSISWKDDTELDVRPPATYRLRVVEPIDPKGTPSRDVDGNPKVFDDGNPMIDLVLRGHALSVPEGCDRLKDKDVLVFIPKSKKNDLFKQFAAAQTAAGKVLDEGDIVDITLVAKRKDNPTDKYAKKYHKVVITPGQPGNAFAAAAAPAASNDDPPF